MFERFAQMAQARRALAAGEWERAGRLAAAPKLARCRGAQRILDRAIGNLVARARKRMAAGDRAGAEVDVQRILNLAPEHAEAEAIQLELHPPEAAEEAGTARGESASAEAASRPGVASEESDAMDRGRPSGSASVQHQRGPQDQDGAAEDPELAGKVDAACAEIEAGSWHTARVVLTEVLAADPGHARGRELLSRIDELEAAQEQVMGEARRLAREGRLRSALATARKGGAEGPSGEPVRCLVAELEDRIEVIDRGVDEVHGALHRAEGGSAAGMRHCLARLQELSRIDSEHPGLAELIAGVESALSAHDKLEPALEALAAGDRCQAMQLLQELPKDALLVRPARKQIVEGVVVTLEEDLERGACGALQKDLEVLDQAVGISSTSEDVAPACVVRLHRLRKVLVKRRVAAENAAAEAEQLLAKALATPGRDGGDKRRRDARRIIAEARVDWVDDGPLDTVEARLIAADHSAETLSKAAQWAKEGDAAQARRHLAAAGATPPALRTRIYDMKRDLARAQGMADGFLLQVDDAGEFLVLRGETVRIGNIRGGPLELPVLANIASQHARLERRMSFHGGMQDTLVAADGEMTHGGQRVEEHRLQSGDEITLGDSLGLRYRLPSKRSLTAELRLLGGFQVAGTDRVLLMKDRGRDGRILLGPGDGTHVRVSSAKGSLEIYAAADGRVFVRCATGGTLDGRPFTGEQALEAGCMVQAAGVGFVVQPWSPEDR